jgi:hypothetical protein
LIRGGINSRPDDHQTACGNCVLIRVRSITFRIPHSKAITADEVRLFDSHLSECKDCRQSSLAQQIAFVIPTAQIERFYQQLTDFLGKADDFVLVTGNGTVYTKADLPFLTP